MPWKLTLHVQRTHVALSNAPVATETDEAAGMKAVSFVETKPLPSYLVALMVGPFDVVNAGTAGHHGTPLRFVVPRGRGGETAYAAEVTPRIVGLLEDFFGMPYPYGKLDVAVVPRYWGTMEHPGLVALGQPLTLIKSSERSLAREQRYANIAAHELAHYWFGDYVTTAWWDDTWLNEALGTWMDERTTAALEPSWRFASRRTHVPFVMNLDSLATAKKIRQPVETKSDVESSFDGGITYGKGSMVLSMFESFVGPAAFQRGIRRYMRDHAWGNATADDLLIALSVEGGRDIGPAFKTFLDQPGVPLVSAEPACKGGAPRIHLTLRRFVPAGSTAADSVLADPRLREVRRREGGRARLHAPRREGGRPAASGREGVPRLGDAERGRDRLLPRRLPPGGAAPPDLEGEEGSHRGGARLAARRRGRAHDERRAPARRRARADPRARRWRRSADHRAELRAPRGRAARPDPARASAPSSRASCSASTASGAARSAWKARPGEAADDRLTLRREMLALTSRAPARTPERCARRPTISSLKSGSTTGARCTPDLVDVVLYVAGLSNDRALFDKLKRAALAATDHEERSRLAGALGGFPEPALAREAVRARRRVDALDAASDSMGIWFGARLQRDRDPRRRLRGSSPSRASTP